MATKVNALTTILEQGSVLAPGVFDALTALIAEQAGFRCEAQWIDSEWPFAENLLVAA